MKRGFWGLAILLAAAAALSADAAHCCPFCSASATFTFGEEFRNVDAVVIAELLEVAEQPKEGEFKKSKFTVVHTIKGQDLLPEAGPDGSTIIEVGYFGKQTKGATFLVMATDPSSLMWSTPVPLSKRGVEYMSRLLDLPVKGPERLLFYLPYLEDGDDLLARDSYDEFARASYAEVKTIKDKLDREHLLKRIADPEISSSLRRLYLTMLGICGKPEDAEVLEGIITKDTDEPKLGLDAMIACYLTLKGPEGMKLIEEKFLANGDADYTETYAAIMALRFHGSEEQIIPRERLLEGMRLMLQRPSLADLVIPDLARWQDWSVAEKLVELFKKSDEKTTWVRVPVVQYLRACPLPEAEKMIAELEKIDPESVRRASLFLPPGGAKRGAAAQTAGTGDKPKEGTTSAATGSTLPPGADAAKAEATGATGTTGTTPLEKPADVPPPVQPAAARAAEKVPPAGDSAAENKESKAIIWISLAVAAVILVLGLRATRRGG
jgi:hypothetical protein